MSKGYVKEFRKLARKTNQWILENKIQGVSIKPPVGWAEYFNITEDINWLWRHVSAELINVSKILTD